MELKLISRKAIPAALAKAERYRLLGQPRMAESICRDVLTAEPSSPEALTTLLLCLTDQFVRPGSGVGVKEAMEVLALLPGDYEKLYYEGVIHERWGKALLSGRSSPSAALDWLRHASSLFEKAQAMRPPDDDESILHWNACARLIQRLEQAGAAESEFESEGAFRDEAPRL